MPDRTCTVDGCDRKAYGHGWCEMHYKRWLRHGDPTITTRRPPSPGAVCKIDSCTRPVKAKGMCNQHYMRAWHNGDPLSGGRERVSGATLSERLAAGVDKSGGPDACWPWTGSSNGKGYGQTWDGDLDRMVYTHRLAYELANGPIPDGLYVDHMCHSRRCCNPGHLRVATPGQNMQNRAGANRDSTLGIRGVIPSWGKYQAQYILDGQTYIVGRYDTVDEAERAVRAARRIAMPYSQQDQA